MNATPRNPVHAIVTLTMMLGALAGCAGNPAARVLEPDDASLASLAWLTGAWVSRDADGPRTEEHWMPPSGGTMIGVNRTVAGGRTIFFEYLRIVRGDDGEVSYLASPAGRAPAVAFRLVEAEPGRLVFENPDHDYPQRIMYLRRSGGALTQRIEGEEGGEFKQSEWSLVRARVRASP